MFRLISDVAAFLGDFPNEWCMSGGWALDLFLGRVTRKHLDVDVCVFADERVTCVQFFVDRGWTVEAKLGTGFSPIDKASDFVPNMPYFWAWAPGTDFCSAYINEQGDRRFHYKRSEQISMDYVEVYFPKLVHGSVVHGEHRTAARPLSKAVLQVDTIRYLAPELVFLFKADYPKSKDLEDLDAVWQALSAEQQDWLVNALAQTHSVHPWFDLPRFRPRLRFRQPGVLSGR